LARRTIATSYAELKAANLTGDAFHRSMIVSSETRGLAAPRRVLTNETQNVNRYP
jgi:hypothetical protein